MTVGYKAFRKAQFKIEGTPGADPTVDKILAGSLSFNPEITWYEPDEDTGKLTRFTRRTKVGERTSLRFEGAVNAEQLINFFAIALVGGVKGGKYGEEANYLWEYEPSLVAANAPDTMYIEAGDSAQVWDIPYVFATNLELVIAMNAPIMLRADLVGRPMTKGTFTGDIALPVVEDLLSNQVELFIDSTWAGGGGTKKSSLLVAGTIRIPTGLVPIDYADGNLYYGGYAEGKRHVELDLTFVLDADAITEYDALQANALRVIYLQVTGSAIPPGSRKRMLSMQFAGKWQSWDVIGEHEGLDVVSARFVTEYDPAAGDEANYKVVNGVSAY